MTKFISLQDFITYCEHVENNVRFKSNLEARLYIIKNHIVNLLDIFESDLPFTFKIFDLTEKYNSIDNILHDIFINKGDRKYISYEKLYIKLTEFIQIMDETLEYYHECKQELISRIDELESEEYKEGNEYDEIYMSNDHLHCEICKLDDLVQKIKDLINSNSFIDVVKLNTD
jgi:hypothetical protein